MGVPQADVRKLDLALALLVAVGARRNAAITLPANSVGTKQIKDHSVIARKVDRKALASPQAVPPNGS